MARIIYIKEARTKGYLAIGVAEGEEKRALVASAAVYAEIGSPMRGEELSEQVLCALDGSSEEYRAMKKALSLLGYADNSARALGAKLVRAGFSREVAGRVVDEVVRLGYIREDEQLERLILAEAGSRLAGPMKLIPKLVSKGYSAAAVRDAMRSLCERGELDFEENKRRLIEKRLGEEFTDEERREILYKNGYKV